MGFSVWEFTTSSNIWILYLHGQDRIPHLPGQGYTDVYCSEGAPTRTIVVQQGWVTIHPAAVSNPVEGHTGRGRDRVLQVFRPFIPATMAAAKGLADSTIQSLGRWRSESFKRYVQIPVAEFEVAAISGQLVD